MALEIEEIDGGSHDGQDMGGADAASSANIREARGRSKPLRSERYRTRPSHELHWRRCSRQNPPEWFPAPLSLDPSHPSGHDSSGLRFRLREPESRRAPKP